MESVRMTSPEDAYSVSHLGFLRDVPGMHQWNASRKSDQKPHKGIILLRLDDEPSVIKIGVIRQLLENYVDKLENQFVVVSENAVRFAKMK